MEFMIKSIFSLDAVLSTLSMIHTLLFLQVCFASNGIKMYCVFLTPESHDIDFEILHHKCSDLLNASVISLVLNQSGSVCFLL